MFWAYKLVGKKSPKIWCIDGISLITAQDSFDFHYWSYVYHLWIQSILSDELKPSLYFQVAEKDRYALTLH